MAIEITAELVGRLIAEQFPAWAHLPLTKVEPGGWDNRTFRLGDELSARLPSNHWYREQVAKEQRWLPALAPRLPLPIPSPVAMGNPTAEYPWHWSVIRWLEGETAAIERIEDLTAFAADLGAFLVALERIDPTGGPPPGTHNFWRGGPLTVYDAETRQELIARAGEIDVEAARDIWETALHAPGQGSPVWLHGDVAAGNLLGRDGRLSAVIDFGCCAVGDPASDR
ncbi:MAG: aminoglycoside phosphotransferase family protein, partial [Thermomicrobiales bacterium]|nr:aminoglycoside phosphotransferase family protein [Thermomicrobiales bacterium]